MRAPPEARRWTRHLVHRSERTRTTWTFRLGLILLVGAALWLTRGWWTVSIASSLVCKGDSARSDAILVENFGPDYRVFERAAALRRAGVAARVLMPIITDPDSPEPQTVAIGRTELMAAAARLGPMEFVPTRKLEPISLNVARDVLHVLQRDRVRSVTVVTPLFRSRRSALVYGATFGRAGITVRCEPVRGTQGVDTWTRTWHGVQDVLEQWVKLQYYRLYVLPFRARADLTPRPSQSPATEGPDASADAPSRSYKTNPFGPGV